MSYKHGIYIYEEPTSLVPPVTTDAAMPVAFVTAPIHLSKDPYSITNEPKLCYSYAEAVEHFGFHLKKSIWNHYTAPQVIYSQFALYAVAPIVIINVLDPKIHIEKRENQKLKLQDGVGVIEVDGILIDSIKINKVSDANEEYKEGEHYSLSYDSDGFVVVSVLFGITNEEELNLSYNELAPDKVDIYDIIGGYNTESGKYTGLELMNEIYPRFRLVPGQLIAPKFSSDPSVAAVMETKAGNINGHFRCIAINDIPTKTKTENGNIKKLLYTDVPAWANKNNLVYTRQINCYPKLILGEQEFYYSTQLAGHICRTDAENGGVPYTSPSNKNLKINGICFEGGEELILNVEQANYLNGQGVMTVNNFGKGWTAWGNRTGTYPANADVKDSFIPVRRMFDWIGNTIILTYWGKIDLPMTKRHIDTIVDSINMWFNGLAAREYILGGRIEFLPDDNITTNLLDGIVKFRIKVAPPPPMRQMDFILEYDPSYLTTLFD